MKHSSEEIIEIAKRTMVSIDWGYDTKREINPVFESKEEQMKEHGQMQDHPKYQEIIASLKNYWFIGFGFEPEAELDNNTMFLSIDDDTGEPFEIHHKQAFFNIKKGEDGKYYTEFRRYR